MTKSFRGQFLEEVGVVLGEYDEVNPLLQTQLRDGIRITVTRVVRRRCTEGIPFDTKRSSPRRWRASRRL